MLTRNHSVSETPPPTHSPLPDPKPQAFTKDTTKLNLFGNTSFGLTEEPTDMEIEQSTSHVRTSQLTKAREHIPLPMYEHLTEIFGESLCQRLSTKPLFKAEASTTHKQTIPEINHRRSTHTSAGLLAFLSEEGFKPLKIELPLTILPRPPKRNRWTLVLPKTRLPVTGNVLESQAPGTRPHGHRGTDAVAKGSCASYRRHNSRSGLGTGGVQSVWL